LTAVIDRELATHLLEQVIAVDGEDFVYGKTPMGKCVYQHEGKPSCGIGKALFLAGLPIEVLEALDTFGTDSTAIEDSQPFLRKHGIVFTEAGMYIFSLFQLLQDQGSTWGNILKKTIVDSHFYPDDRLA
jgi:hypothetical protein